MVNVDVTIFKMTGKRTTIFHIHKLNALELCFFDRWIVIFRVKKKKKKTNEKMEKGTKTKKKKMKGKYFLRSDIRAPLHDWPRDRLSRGRN